MGIIWSFLGRPRAIRVDVIDVVGLTLSLDHPHRDGRVGQVCLVEVEHHFLAFEVDLRFGFHVVSPCVWCAGRDSNPHLSVLEADAHPKRASGALSTGLSCCYLLYR